MLISPTEPFPIKGLGKVSPLPERSGADILILANRQRTGVQRKKFPEDLISSLADGRLYQQLHQMKGLDRAILIVEGFGSWTSDGELVDQKVRGFKKEALYALFMSVAFEFGMMIFQVRDINETIRFLTSLEHWAKKDKHNALRTRPSAHKDAWGRRGNRDYGIHLLQSFPGVGPELAGKVFDTFGRAPLSWDITEDDLRTVPGVGKGKAAAMWKVLNE